MGGKGGGGGGGTDDSALKAAGYVLDPNYLGPGMGSYITQAEYDKKYPKAAEAPAVASRATFADVPAPEPEAAPPPPAAPAAPPAPLGPAISSGGAIAGPTAAGNAPFGGTGGIGGLGGGLGGSVLNPPKYWVGGIPASSSSGRGQGKMTTTKT